MNPFFVSVWPVGPKSPSPTTSQPAVRWNYVTLVKAAVTYWHVFRATRAIFDGAWGPRIRWYFRPASKIRAKLALFLPDVRFLPTPAASSVAALRSAARDGEFADAKDGRGEFVDHAVAVRAAASSAIAFFGIRRARPRWPAC